jgi:tetratricopeptide (TPR) repeat protein
VLSIAQDDRNRRDLPPADMPPRPRKPQKSDDPVVEEIYNCVESGNILGAIDCLDRAINTQPDCAHFYAERASFYAQIGNIQQAIADYDRAIAIQPDNRLFQQWRSQLTDNLD